MGDVVQAADDNWLMHTMTDDDGGVMTIGMIDYHVF